MLYFFGESTQLECLSFACTLVGTPDKAWPVEIQQVARKAYYTAITQTDAQVGRVLDELDTLGFEKNTVVIVCADHGTSGRCRCCVLHDHTHDHTHASCRCTCLPTCLHCWLGLPPAHPSHSISAAADKRCLLARSLATAMPCGAVQVGSWVSTGCGISRLSSSWRHVSPCSSKCPGPSPPSVRIPPPPLTPRQTVTMHVPSCFMCWLARLRYSHRISISHDLVVSSLSSLD
jgi:hypothetical protein